MTDNAAGPNVGDERAHQVATRWGSSCHRTRHGVDRDAMVAALLAALDGTAAGSIGLVRQSALFGAHFASIGGSVAALVDELDRLESAVLEHIGADAATKPAHEIVHSVRELHSRAAFARRASTAAFGQTVSSADRQRVRIARHDIANAIGTVRNAILLMEDEGSQGAHEHFRAIARRNSVSSEALVRSHLSDQHALTPALGWEAVSPSDLLAVHDHDTDAPRVVANVAAVAIVLDLIRAIDQESARRSNSTLTFTANDANTGVLTVQLGASGERMVAAEVVSGLRDLATTLGLRLEGDVESDDLRLIVPLSPRDQEHDLGSVRQGQHANAVAL